MKIVHVTRIFALLTVMSLSALTAQAISLTEYTFPTSQSQDAYVSGAFSAGGNSVDTTQTGFNATGTASYQYDYRSLPFSYKFNAYGNLSTDKSTTKGEKEKSSYDFNVFTRANRYLNNESKFFGFGELHVQFNKPLTQTHAYHTYQEIAVGAGYGRTINATVLKQAVRMSEDFKRFLVTKGEIPDDALLKLARIIDTESEYRTNYGPVEYRKYWYNAMEDVLRETGMLVGDRLGAMGIIRIQEVLAEPTGQRFYGWEVRAGVGVVLSDYNGEKGDPKLEVALDWSRPVDISLQLNNNFYANTVLKTDSSLYNVGNTFQVYYEFSNRIHWDNKLDIREVIRTKNGQKNSNESNFSSAFQFYIENELNFNTTFSFRRTEDNVNPLFTNWAISSGINYRLR